MSDNFPEYRKPANNRYCPFGRMESLHCLGDACAWWMYTTESCAVQVLALHALDRITVADDKDLILYRIARKEMEAS